MSDQILIESLPDSSSYEMAERKGTGHPDTICDGIAEAISVALCRYYLDEFGIILHHNVDKVLLVGGQSQAAFKGGHILEPMEIILAGKATHTLGNHHIPVGDIAEYTTKNWLKNHLRFVDTENHVQITSKIRPGSSDLTNLYQRFGRSGIPLSNDTSFGVAYYPCSPLEKTILDTEKLLNHPKTKERFPYIGEDIKVMGVHSPDGDFYTVAIAMVDRFILNTADYISKIEAIKQFISTSFNFPENRIAINTADDYEKSSLYLTVSGTSAESGDDGEVGRGNRINGLITPYRPMSLEAVAGKNPVSHIGKVYNHFAYELSKSICEHKFAEEAQVFIVSQIGMPITSPQFLNIKLKHKNCSNNRILELTNATLSEMSTLYKKLLGADDAFEIF